MFNIPRHVPLQAFFTKSICGHIWSKPVLVEPHNKLNIADLRQQGSQSPHHNHRASHCCLPPSFKKAYERSGTFLQPNATLQLLASVCFSVEHARPRDAYVKKSSDITSSCMPLLFQGILIENDNNHEKQIALK